MSVIASSIYILCVVQDTASFVNAQIIGAVTQESACFRKVYYETVIKVFMTS